MFDRLTGFIVITSSDAPFVVPKEKECCDVLSIVQHPADPAFKSGEIRGGRPAHLTQKHKGRLSNQ